MLRLLPTMFALAACSITPQIPMARVAMHQFPHDGFRAAALPVSCRSIVAENCSDAITRAVALSVRSELEFAGLTIIDSELLVAASRQRVDTIVERREASTFTAVRKTGTLGGEVFSDLSLSERLSVMESLSLDGIVRVALSTSISKYVPLHNITIAMVDRHDRILWTSSCELESVKHYTSTRAIETAALCASRAALDEWRIQ